MVLKRYLQWMRSYRLIIAILFLPLLFTIIGLAVVKTVPTVGNEPILLFGLTDGYGPNTIFYSQEDAGGDHYTGAYDATAAALSRDGLRPANALQHRFRSQLYRTVGGSDPRFSQSSLLDISGLNMTNYVLDAADNYFRTLFYHHKIVSISSEPGPFRIHIVNNSCGIRVNNEYVTGLNLTLAAGQAYDFVLYKSTSSDSLLLSTSPTGGFGTFLLLGSSSQDETVGYNSGQLSSLRWNVPPSAVGETLYLFCNFFEPQGVPLHVINTTVNSSYSTGKEDVFQRGGNGCRWGEQHECLLPLASCLSTIAPTLGPVQSSFSLSIYIFTSFLFSVCLFI